MNLGPHQEMQRRAHSTQGHPPRAKRTAEEAAFSPYHGDRDDARIFSGAHKSLEMKNAL